MCADAENGGADAGVENTGAQLELAMVIAQKLAPLSPSHLEVINESDQHRGHPGAKQGAHFRVKIRAAAFADMPPLARHRLIYQQLGSLPALGIHALAIEAEAS